MYSATAVTVLRLVHILAGVAWVGAVLFMSVFLIPSLRAIGPLAAPVMEQIAQVRRLPIYMMAMAILAILSGIGLYWRDSGGFQTAWMHSGPGTVFGIGGALAIVAMVIGMAVSSPAGRRLGALGTEIRARGGPPTPAEMAEMQRLQARVARGGQIVSVLLVLATAAMAIARYVS